MDIFSFFQYAKPIVTVLHVISVVFGMGAALLSDVLFGFYGKDKRLSKNEITTLSILSTIVWWSLVVITISGVGLFLSNVQKYLHSVKFLTKMTILLVLVVNGYVLNRVIWPHVIRRDFLTNAKEKNIRRGAFVCGAISVLSWVSVCMLGVLDSVPFSYAILMTFYGSVVVVAVCVALIVENRSLESKRRS